MPRIRGPRAHNMPPAPRQAMLRSISKPSAAQVYIASLARQRTAALAELCALNVTGALFVGEVKATGSLAVVAVRPDRIERRWLSAQPEAPVEIIPTKAISAVSVTKGPGLDRTVTLTALGRGIDYEFDFAQAQAFHLALATILDLPLALIPEPPSQPMGPELEVLAPASDPAGTATLTQPEV